MRFFFRPWYFFVALFCGGVMFVLYQFFFTSHAPELAAATPAVTSAIDTVLAARQQDILTDASLAYADQGVITLLTLGIDSRKEGSEQHCDAIHLVTFDTRVWTIDILSVPRGTYSALPSGKEYLPTDYYLANACAYGGLEYGIAQIEKVTGIRADYVATVGFSQALGIFRLLNLPTTETLQWLRHRQSYALGDPQRSQNQATFMKDVALSVFARDELSLPFFYILYSFLDTDLSFADAHALYVAYLASGIAEHPERITFSMKPFYETQEYHFDAEHAEEQIADLLLKLEGRLSSEDLSHATLAQVQEALVAYLYEALGDDAQYAYVFEEQLWNQVEDSDVREELHYRFLERYVRTLRETDALAAQNLVTDYVWEMQFFGLSEWEKRGRTLLATFARE